MKEVNVIRERKTNKAYRPDLLEESLKAIFINKKVHIFTNIYSIKGTCVDVVKGDFCLTDVVYKVSSTGDPALSIKGKSSYMMTPKSGKNIAILD